MTNETLEKGLQLRNKLQTTLYLEGHLLTHWKLIIRGRPTWANKKPLWHLNMLPAHCNCNAYELVGLLNKGKLYLLKTYETKSNTET